ncbi:aminoglycoside phosphotransferase (APT) family kinase protein [Paenibacillus taihuensis]|uniref:Aminoglycoside phosphotransferase (APT) family kinase protein n=1 Tax=Paenibacillus taihuensis TaxID=1156355 RepID=A0A3D9S7T4_9BACL|nr:phosphotransferase [Paenibacillus taihuensis]REE89104.1 aminoglycoside phosphotransferase (APT) family kinase protein [Paenibacillus taihuensis]
MMLGKCVGIGSSCEVYEWDESADKVVKLYHSHARLEHVQREFRNSSVACSNGLSVPRPYEIVNWGGRHGIVYERISGETLVNRIYESLYAFEPFDMEAEDHELRILAKVLHEIHQASTEGIQTSQRDNLKWIIGHPEPFSPEEVGALHAYMDLLPPKRQLCHGDTNLSNLILNGDRYVMIDWMHASIGNPEADVAEVCVSIEYAVLPPETPADVDEFFQTIRQAAYRIFIDEYCKLSGVTEAEIRAWYPPMAARSMASGALQAEQVEMMAAMIREKIVDQEAV